MRVCSRRAGVLRGHTEPGGRAAVMRTGEETTLHRPSSGVLPAALRSGWGEERSGPRILGVLTVGPRDTWWFSQQVFLLAQACGQLWPGQPAHFLNSMNPALRRGSSAKSVLPGAFSPIPGRPFRFLCVVTFLLHFHNSLCQLGLRLMY